MAVAHAAVGAAYIAGVDQGWSDDILVSADKNPNTAGAMAIGAGRLRNLLDLSNDLKAGAVTALIVVGTQGVLGKGPGGAALPLDRLQTLVALGTHKDAGVQAAQVALPLAQRTELDGTFTNRLRMVQRVRAAVPAAGDSLPGRQILSHLARKLGA